MSDTARILDTVEVMETDNLDKALTGLRDSMYNQDLELQLMWLSTMFSKELFHKHKSEIRFTVDRNMLYANVDDMLKAATSEGFDKETSDLLFRYRDYYWMTGSVGAIPVKTLLLELHKQDLAKIVTHLSVPILL